MKKRDIARLIIQPYSINGYINLFKLSDSSHKTIINVKINITVRSRLRNLLKCIKISDLGIKKNYGITGYTERCWMRRLDKLPLSLIFEILTVYHNKVESKRTEILRDASFFIKNFKEFNCRGSFATRLPNEFSQDLFYLIGVIMGDGSLPMKFNGDGKRQYDIVVEKANFRYINYSFKPLFDNVFDSKKSKVFKTIHRRKKAKYRFIIKSRIIHLF